MSVNSFRPRRAEHRGFGHPRLDVRTLDGCRDHRDLRLRVAAFVLAPNYTLSVGAIATPLLLVLAATVSATVVASRLVNRLEPTELLRDE